MREDFWLSPPHSIAEAFDAQNPDHRQHRRSAQTSLNGLLHGRQVRVQARAPGRPQLLQLPRGAIGASVTADRSEAAAASAQAAESR